MKKLLFILLFSLLIIGCPTWQPGGKYNPENGEDTEVEQHDELFIQDSESADTYSFYTNNTSYINDKGYTLFTTPFVCSGDSIEVSVNKSSGSTAAGYGIVFARKYSSNSEYADDEHDEMYVLMINNSQSYIFANVVDGVFTALTKQKAWLQSGSLYKSIGYNQTLRIDSAINENNRTVFKVYLNNAYIDEYIADEGVVMNGAYYGFVAVISPYEDFKNSSVNVKYEIKN